MLRTAAVPLPHLHGVAVVAALRGGPRYEGPDEGGLTHFMEHAVFLGAGERPTSRELLEAFEDACGDEPEAFTTDDMLVVALEADPDRLGEAVALRGDVLLAPRYHDIDREREVILEERLERVDEDGRPTDLDDVLLAPRYHDIDREREVILEERLERVDEDGRPTDLDDAARALTFCGQPLARSILGTEAGIRGFGRDDLEDLRGRIVRDENVVVVAAGPVDDAALARAAAPLGAVPAGPALTDGGLAVAAGPRTEFVDLSGSTQVDLRLSFVGPGQADPRYPALTVLHDLLDGGPTGRIPQTLVDSGLAYAASAELVPFPELSLLVVDVAVGRDKLLEAVEQALAVAADLGRFVEDEELERAARRRRHRARRRRDDALDAAEWAARRLLRGLPADHAAEDARADDVDAAGAATLARDVLRPEALTAVALGAPRRRRRQEARRLIESWRPDA